jgi:phage protein D
VVQRTHYRIDIDGKDITSTVTPLLISLKIDLKDGGVSNKADLSLDDENGQIALPRDGASMKVSLRTKRRGWSEVFRGKVTETRSTGSRGEPYVLKITADGVDTKGKAKEPQERHWDNATIKTILEDAGKDAGITTIKVDSELASISMPYEAMEGESFMALGQRLAEAVGGTFTISDGRAAMVKRSSGKSASGKALTPIRAAWGVNLISWDIAPYAGRARYKKTRQRYYDKKEAKWKEVETQTEDTEASATSTHRFPASDKAEADRRTKADKTTSEREKGGGSIVIDGDEYANPEAPVAVVGVRPGIDGDFIASSVSHDVSRSGYTTSIELKRPAGKAGKDTRGKTSAGGMATSVAATQGAAIKADPYATP